jgi:sugar phosphate isomerase/epimerase
MDRRQFIYASALAAGGFKGSATAHSPSQKAMTGKLKIDIYGRHLLWLKTAEEVALAAKETGYDGVDLNIRPNGQGHILPERVREDLPPFVATIRRYGIEVSAVTPPIVDADSPYAENILRTASELGVHYYWWGTFRYAPGKPIMQQLDELKPRVAKLAALNARYKMTAMYHTYAGNAIGAPIWDLLHVLEDFDPTLVGFHYDLGHMTREGANGLWATNLRAAGPYVRGVSVKDFIWVKDASGRWRTQWVPLGEGLVRLDEFAAILKEIGFSGPIENQPEYPEGVGGETRITIPRETVLRALKKDQEVLRKALAAAGLV